MHINFSLKRKFISFLRKWYEDDDIVSRELFWTPWYTVRFKSYDAAGNAMLQQETENFHEQNGLGTGNTWPLRTGGQ